VHVPDPAGLLDVLWSCGITRTPTNGIGGIDVSIELFGQGPQQVGLTASIDPNHHFVEIMAQATLPGGVPLLNPDDDQHVFIEPVNGVGTLKSAFE